MKIEEFDWDVAYEKVAEISEHALRCMTSHAYESWKEFRFDHNVIQI